MWVIPLDVEPEAVLHMERALPADERAALQRFGRPLLRRRAAVAHGAFRTVLARYLDQRPAEITLTEGPRCKPRLADSKVDLHFNLAHSGERAVVAVTSAVEVGVDIEAHRAMKDVDALGARYLAPNELQELRLLPVAERERRFIRLWACKEAFVKALGQGLAHPLDRFEVDIAADGTAHLASIAGDPRAAGNWTLHAMNELPDYAIAVAAPRPALRVARWDYWQDIAS